MFAITTGAGSHLAEILATAEAPEQGAAVIRMFLSKEGLGLAVDQEKEEDSKYDHEGNTVLVIDEKLVQALEGKTLDVETTDEGTSLMLR
jgi:Fe-S cluster assembly iron-binding protein IscA